MNTVSDTFPVLSTRSLGVLPSVVIRNGGGYPTRKHDYLAFSRGGSPSQRVCLIDPYDPGMPPPAATATPRLQCQYERIAYAKGTVGNTELRVREGEVL